MRKVLVPVDGSEHSDRAVRFVVDFVRQHGPIDIHLVNVQPEPLAWQTHGMGEEAIAAHLGALSHQAMKSAQEILRESGIPCHVHHGRGDTAGVIVALANRLGCDVIVMATRGLGAMSGLALGSVTTKHAACEYIAGDLCQIGTRSGFVASFEGEPQKERAGFAMQTVSQPPIDAGRR